MIPITRSSIEEMFILKSGKLVDWPVKIIVFVLLKYKVQIPIRVYLRIDSVKMSIKVIPILLGNAFCRVWSLGRPKYLYRKFNLNI